MVRREVDVDLHMVRKRLTRERVDGKVDAATRKWLSGSGLVWTSSDGGRRDAWVNCRERSVLYPYN
jgi:hypothetical protein